MAKKPKVGTPVDVAEYYALSNTAVDGRHFAEGAPIEGVTNRDQIDLAVRRGVIGSEPPSAVRKALNAAAARAAGDDDTGTDETNDTADDDNAVDENAGDDTGDRDAD